MRRGRLLSLAVFILMVLSYSGMTGEIPSSTISNSPLIDNNERLAQSGGPYIGTGLPLNVTFTGEFSNGSTWSATGTTYSEDLSTGSSFSVTNATTALWTTYVSVSPPAEVVDLNFTIDYHVSEWKPLSVTNPLGVAKTNPTDWTYASGAITVKSSAVDTYGLWKFEFTASNHIYDLKMGTPSESDTNDFVLTDEMVFTATTSWVSGGSSQLILTDPSGNPWYTASNTTSGTTAHELQAFMYHKDITVDNGQVWADLVDYPFLIDIDDSDLFFEAKNDGSDIVFVQNSHVLNHEIELYDRVGNSAHLVAWVKCNLSNSVDTTITMYYGSNELGPMESPEEVWTNNYEAVWHLGEQMTNEQTNGIHVDATGNGYYGNQNGNDDVPSSIATGIGQRFDGDDWILVNASNGLDPVSDTSLSGWFYLPSGWSSSSTPSMMVMAKYLDGDNNFHIALAGSEYTESSVPAGSLVFGFEYTSGEYVKWTTTTSWSVGWYHFTCMMDAGTPSNNRIYINGVDTTAAGSSGGAVSVSLAFSSDWGIGGRYGETSEFPTGEAFMTGDIDEVRVSNGIRTSNWILTEYSNQISPGTFYTLGSEQSRTSPDPVFRKSLDVTAPAGVWTASLHYNDSGSSVNYRTGKYEREFIVRHPTSLTVDSPGVGVSSRVVGDILYVAVDLTDTVDVVGVAGATVSMNWTVSGSPTTVYFEDSSDGYYTTAVDTTDLSLATRWRIDIQATHTYYESSSTFFNLDLYHPTQLTYDSVSTTPVGQAFNATLVYTDTYTGLPITGADITFSNGTPISVISEANGRYDISIPTTGLPKGDYWHIFNATHPTGLYNMASINVTFTLRAHYTAVSVSGDLIVPFGEDSLVTVVLIDLDTGLEIDISDVTSITFDSSRGIQVETTYSVLLNTDAWPVSTTSITVSVVMSNTDLFAPTDYIFDHEMRSHYTSVSVTGVMTMPYGNDTNVNVVLTDLDTGLLVDISEVTSLSFASSYGTQPDAAGDYVVLLDTDTWTVGSTTVTLTVVMASADFEVPDAYDFQVTIRSLVTVLIHEPSDLIFPNGDDFNLILQFNVSEAGQYYMDTIDGFATDFSVPGYPVANVTFVGLGGGMYDLTIDSFHFPEGTYSITIEVNPSSSTYAPAFLVVVFDYRPTRSDLTANLYTVSTPYNMNVTVTLHYEDLDRSLGITTGVITTPDTWISFVHVANGDYDVVIGVAAFAIGTHQVNLTADADGYDARSVTINVIITRIHTDANPEHISFDMPVGNTVIFYIEFNDLDNSIPISGASYLNNWTGDISLDINWAGSYYLVNFTTSNADILGDYLIWFNFTKGANYQPGYCEIAVTVRTHTTIFESQSSPAPTSYNGLVNISVRYYDFDNKVGITDDANIQQYIWNTTHWVSSTLINDGVGFYTIQISASQFQKGVQSFTVYFNWTGPVQKYEDRQIQTSVNIVGVDSKLTLMISSVPTAYGELMNYTFFYSDLSNIGIDNVTAGGGGHVHISVSFQGVTVDLAQVDINEVLGQPGNYSIGFNNSIFGDIGLIYMNVYINWTETQAPFYTSRSDVISVNVLARDTLVSIIPPSPAPYGENATFTFSFDDVTGALNTPIANSPSLVISLTLTEYALRYNISTKLFSVSFDTSQFGTTLGAKSFTLSISWNGAPFYSNRTGNSISVTVIARQTVLDYQSPAPTSYLEVVTFVVNWTDVTGGAIIGIDDATITLYNGAVQIPNLISNYNISWISGGAYQIELSTVYFGSPGFYNLKVQLSSDRTYILDIAATRSFNVRERVTLLSVEPLDKQPYNSTLVFILNYLDYLTYSPIGNLSGDVTLEILNASTWYYSVTWNNPLHHYEFSVDTYNHPEFAIDTQYSLKIRFTYDVTSPYYSTDDTHVLFEFRTRASALDLEDPPDATPYLDFASFRVFYRDVDSTYGISINPSDFTVVQGITPLVLGTEFFVTSEGGGFYTLDVNSTVLGLGTTILDITASWGLSSPYHDDAGLSYSVRVVNREANVDIVTPPGFTQYLDNVEFTFTYTDVLRGTPISGITESDIDIWANGTLLGIADFTLVQNGNLFELILNSTKLGTELVSGYNLTIYVDWNDVLEPYYLDDSTIVRVTTTTRAISFALNSVDAASLGQNISISFSLTDADNSSRLIDDALILFDAQTVSLTENVDFWIIRGIGASLGTYTIRINSTVLFYPGSYKFDLDIQWNPAIEPYFANLTTIQLTGVVLAIETDLTPQVEVVTVLWKESAIIRVSYHDLLHSNLTSGATIVWYWPSVATGNFSEIGVSGEYSAAINTSLEETGTHVITITAMKDRYTTAVTYITLVVTTLPSEMLPIDPSESLILLSRGSGVDITVYLEDGQYGGPINNISVVEVKATFESVEYLLAYNGTPGYYNTTIPAGGPTILTPGAYTVRLSAEIDNYDPASNLFKIDITETKTEVQLVGDTLEEMTVVFSQQVNLTIRVVAPDLSNLPMNGSYVRLSISEKSYYRNLTEISNGYYYITLNTSEIGYGIWGVSFRATPEDPVFALSATQLTINVKRIETLVIRPSSLDVTWGWSGYVDFMYWDESFDIGIEEAIVEYSGINGTTVHELANGTYAVFINTTILSPGPSYTLNILFQKLNYQEGSGIIQVTVQEVPTDIVVISPEKNQLSDELNLQIPIGDSFSIDFFFNDTDNQEGYVGGLAGAIATDRSYIQGRSISGRLDVTLIELGGGYYRIIFDTMDETIAALVTTVPYDIYLELSLENRQTRNVEVHITVIDIPTEVIIQNELPPEGIVNGQPFTLQVYYNDTWHGTGITGADLNITKTTGAVIIEWEESSTTDGLYLVHFTTGGIWNEGSGIVSIEIGIGDHLGFSEDFLISVIPNEQDVLFTNLFNFGLPIGLIVALISAGYIRVWSVPKQLRKINGQIKALRKGKVPKPISDAKSRQQLVAELFNDTMSDLSITRDISQVPAEAVEIVVPEMGELLIQLSILTHLSQEELDEFKADISKMKISEQASFVKEVIVQEAIRAARRDGKDVDTVIAEVEAEASKRIRVAEGEVVVEVVEEEVELEILRRDEEVIIPDTPEPDEVTPIKSIEDFDAVPSSDKLSQFELEELQMDLVRRGVEDHEIDTIMRQVRELPRDLVEELLRSLGIEEDKEE